MLYLVIALFALAAVLGLTILVKWLTHKNAPRGVVYSHGLVAATGLVLLAFFALQHPDSFPKLSLILFVIAALGGFYMFFQDVIKKTTPPVAIAFVHALLAVSGFVALLLFVFA
jgi:hypothetical protein